MDTFDPSGDGGPWGPAGLEGGGIAAAPGNYSAEEVATLGMGTGTSGFSCIYCF